MTLAVKVQGGTNAGWRRIRHNDLNKCACGGFIAKVRADQGATLCVRCEQGESQ